MFPSRIIDTMHPLSQALRIRCCKHYASADAGGIHPLMQEASREGINAVSTKVFPRCCGLDPQSVTVWEMVYSTLYDNEGVEFKQRSKDNTAALDYIKLNKY